MNAPLSSGMIDHDPFAGPELVAFAPITEAQREVWLACVIDPELNIGYNEGIDLRIEGVPDIEVLKASLQTLIDRHEALRMVISPDGNSLCVQKSCELQMRQTEAADNEALGKISEELMLQSFSLENGPLHSFTLVKRSADRYDLLFVAHHIICDGWSLAVLLTELGEIYSAGVEKREPVLGKAPRYTDYVTVEREFLQSADGQNQERYWLNRLQDLPATLDLPSSKTRPAERKIAANRIDRELPADLVPRLRKTASSQGASLVAMLLTGFSALLNRLTQSEDMVIGLSAAGQSMHEQGQLVGHCVNLLPLRIAPRADAKFSELLKAVKTVVLDASDNQGITFGALIPKLDVKRDNSRPPLVSVIFNIDVRDDDISHTGLKVSYSTMVRRAETFELYLNVVDDGKSLVVEASYGTELFSADDIERLLENWFRLLTSTCDNVEQSVQQLALQDAATRQRITQTWNATQRDYPQDVTLHTLIEQQVGKTPDSTALIFEGDALSFDKLNSRSNQLAHELIARGAGPDKIVAICAQRGMEMVVAMLATLKAGAAYLPLDPAFPADRLEFMIQDSEACVILCEIEGSEEVSPEVSSLLESQAERVLDLKKDADKWAGQSVENPQTNSAADNLAYVIYTSGSTGKPKGALLEHRSIINRLLWMQDEYQLTPSDRVLQKTPYSFDVSVWEFFWPLLTGTTMVIAKPEGHKDPSYLTQLIDSQKVTVCHFVPSMLAVFLEDAKDNVCPGLRSVFCSGEALTTELVQRFYGECRNADLHNLYGPTEAAVDVSYWPCPRERGNGIVPIGKPVANTALYILDSRGEPLPIGVSGELMLGGVQLARGYLNRAELTAEKFIQHPEFGRLYRTGDLACWNANGDVEYQGRLDFQVKLHGLRIELGEIEAELVRHEQVIEAVAGVVERSAGDSRLVAWIQSPPDQSVNVGELRSFLRKTLPAYMIPQTYRSVEDMPRLSSGKINRKALPEPFAATDATQSSANPPRSATQIAVRDIWAEVLGVQTINLSDRFIDLGGHSLLAVQTSARISKQFSVKLPLRTILMESLATISDAIDKEAPETASKITESGSADKAASPQAIHSTAVQTTGALTRIKRWFGFS